MCACPQQYTGWTCEGKTCVCVTVRSSTRDGHVGVRRVCDCPHQITQFIFFIINMKILKFCNLRLFLDCAKDIHLGDKSMSRFVYTTSLQPEKNVLRLPITLLIFIIILLNLDTIMSKI